MPRPKPTDKFYLVNTRATHFPKGTRFVGAHNGYVGKEPVTLKDLNQFLKINKVDPNKVHIDWGFITTVSK